MSPDSERRWTVLDLLQWTTAHFKERGVETPRLDAECLLAYALGCDRLRLYVDYEKRVEEAERGRFRELVKARGSERMPVAYLTGKREFWSLPLAVNPSVLVPRPESECLVEAALAWVSPAKRVLEIGTGSGAITLALASECADAEYWASDVSSAALAVAQKNAQDLVPEVEIRWVLGDLFAPLGGERFDLLIANPPYVAEADREGLAPELRHEPEVALFAGPEGLAVLERLVREAPTHLKAGGALIVELDLRQVDAVKTIALGAGFDPAAAIRDAAGRQRALTLCLPAAHDGLVPDPAPVEPS